MGQPYIGEIRIFAGNFAPNGWELCDDSFGRPISENDALYTLIGTRYGGDGQETFCLPNLASRVPIHMGTLNSVSYTQGETGGTEQETLTIQQIPVHSHAPIATTAQGTASPNNAQFGSATSSQAGTSAYTNTAPVTVTTALSPQTISPIGGSQPHENTQPFLCVNFIISLFGVFPTQT